MIGILLFKVFFMLPILVSIGMMDHSLRIFKAKPKQQFTCHHTHMQILNDIQVMSKADVQVLLPKLV
jgi:hypothetical protein